MSEPETRAPLPAKTQVSPLAEYTNGNLYPYWNLKDSGLTPYLNVVRRAFANINPFSVQQVPTSERIGLNVRLGRMFYKQQPYPSGITFSDKFPAHYNPLSDTRFKEKPHVRHVHFTPELNFGEAVTRFCQRQITNYKRCVVANDGQETVCTKQQENIISICPQWSLNNLRQKKLALTKNEARLNNLYRSVMEVPSYNKGRTVADVPLRSWEDGERQNLRPATMWADDRYADITKEQVIAAQQRLKRRRQANPGPLYKVEDYNRQFQVPPRETPLYSA